MSLTLGPSSLSREDVYQLMVYVPLTYGRRNKSQNVCESSSCNSCFYITCILLGFFVDCPFGTNVVRHRNPQNCFEILALLKTHMQLQTNSAVLGPMLNMIINLEMLCVFSLDHCKWLLQSFGILSRACEVFSHCLQYQTYHA